jgi:hypothetical protein
MRSHTLMLSAAAVAFAMSATLVGQSQATRGAPAAPARPAAGATQARPTVNPRTADGHPDLQGVYDLATLTPLERPAIFGNNLTLTPQQAQRLEQQVADRKDQAARPSDGNRAAPPIGGDGSTGAAGNVGGYNNFWIDNGSEYVTVNGEKRTSIIVEPANGRVPQVTAAARQRQAARPNTPTSDEQEGTDPGLERAPGAYDDPERRPLGERCLLGFGSTSGPPSLPVLYNNLHQIVQTKDHIMILNEMDHDARIIRMNQPHLPATVKKWLGDSVGHWEGDTLVVDTTNFTDKTRFRGSTDQLHVVERFTRMNDKTLLYRFTVEDSATWSQAWTGEYTWPSTDTQLFEYACHEGNYALGNILRGARQRDAEEAAKRSGNR